MSGPPIVAIATAPGEAAIAVLRLSGPGSFAVADRIFRGRKSVGELPPRQAARGRVVAEDESALDEVLLLPFPGPQSYTGEEMVEISCHGGRLVAGLVLQRLLQAGARLADPGEFTQRAFLNGKLDLTQAEAVMDLITAKTPLAVRAANEQLEGRLGQAMEKLAAQLLDLLAHLEAWIDFPEEDIQPETGAAFVRQIEGVEVEIARLLATALEGRILREGVRLAIVGRPNAGKSSLLNCLLGFDRAIVSERPGTTRDTIEELINLGGVPFRVVDTAGLRETEDAVERAGIERTRRAVEQADVVLEVLDASAPEPGAIELIEKPHVVVWNKIDLVPEVGCLDGLRVSCRSGEGMADLVQHLVKVAGHHMPEGNQSLVAINARHQACLQRAGGHLAAAGEGLRAGQAPELVAVELRGAVEALGEVTGRLDVEDLLGRIFQLFCIGK
jgi:tRNA modification GTPase